MAVQAVGASCPHPGVFYTSTSIFWRLGMTECAGGLGSGRLGSESESSLTERIDFEQVSSCCCGCLVTKSCPALCDSMDCIPPGFSVHGILQARIVEWIAISFSRGSSQPRDQTVVSCISQVDSLPLASLVAQMVRICLKCRRPRLDPWVGNIHWRKAWKPTLVFLPGEFHGPEEPSRLLGHDWATNTFTLSLPLSHQGSPSYTYLHVLTCELRIKTLTLTL